MILSENGKRVLAIGGEHAWKQYRKGDVLVTYQWVNDEPCMCLFAAVGSQNRGAFVIALSALHKYMDNKGYPTRYLVMATVDIAKQLGFTPGKDICMRIADVIADGAQDLVRMPPMPKAVREAAKPEPVGTLEIREGDRAGRLVHEAEV